MADKAREYLRGYAAGMEAAQELVRNGGIEALEKEVRLRGSGVNLPLSGRALDKATEGIKAYTIDTVMILSIASMHDAFGFGATRIRRWMEKFNEGVEYLLGTEGGYSTWEDYIQGIREQTGIETGWRYSKDKGKGMYGNGKGM
jgi:hypothetical protein